MRFAFAYLFVSIPALVHAQDEPPQIRWQRSYEDAVELARQAGRPLLLCVNMDAESASELTARRRYRDPEFVAATDAFVCAIASPVRHNPHDHDEAGRRIPCARFGRITCGEHLAMEPEIFARVGGERIAPRHTLYAVDGRQVFDLVLLFDLSEIDRRVKAAAAEVGSAWEEPLPEALDALCADRRHAARSEVERRWLAADAATRQAVLAAVAASGAGLHPDVLRLALHGADDAAAERAIELARAAGVLDQLEPGLREALLWSTGDLRERFARRWAACLDATDDARRLALSFALDGPPVVRETLRAALARDADPVERARLAALWEGADTCLADVLRDAPAFAIEPRAPWTTVPESPALELLLERLDGLLAVRSDDAFLLYEMGRTSLLLGERAVQDGGNPSFFLADALRFLEEAIAGLPDDARERRATAHLLRARAAFLRNDLGEAQLAARRALAVEGSGKDVAIEAARLALDASLRELSEGFAGLSLVEFGAAYADQVALAARLVPSGELGEDDWQRLANLYAFCGRSGDRAFALRCGVTRLPESVALHASLRDLVWGAGHLPRLLDAYAELEAGDVESATAAWFEGTAWVGLAEQERRVLRFAQALAAYDRAREAFERSAERNGDYEATARQWGAVIDLGEAFCRLELGELETAAERLARAFANGVALDHVDGVEREPQDLIDQLVEHGLPGTRLFEVLADHVPDRGDVLERVPWATFREAYRARGRSEPELSDRFFRETLAVYDELDAAVEGAGNAQDRARALLENARIATSSGDAQGALALVDRAAAALERDWRAEAAGALVERWLAELGPSTTYVRTGR